MDRNTEKIYSELNEVFLEELNGELPEEVYEELFEEALAEETLAETGTEPQTIEAIGVTALKALDTYYEGDLSWRKDGLCSQTDPEAFYPEKGNGSAKAAKAMCSRCISRETCLEWALAHDEQHGVWGGLTTNERRKLKRQRALQSKEAQEQEQQVENPAA